MECYNNTSKYVPIIDNIIKDYKSIKLDRVEKVGNNYIYIMYVNNKLVKLNSPIDYPNGFLFLESDKQYSWIHSINSLILDSMDLDKVVLLKTIFTKLENESKQDDKEYNYDNIYEDYDTVLFKFNKEDDINLDIMQKRWSNKYKKLCEDNISTNELKNINQIFSKDGSYQVLVNDLVNVINEKDNLNLKIFPIDDNVFNWKMQLLNLNNNKLNNQLKELDKEYGYNYIEIEFKFKMHLYPFYPAQVKLLRPRLDNYIMERVATLDILKFSNWNPMTSMITVIETIKQLIEEYALIDVYNPINCLLEDTYSDIEYKLLNLSQLTEINPRINYDYINKKNKIKSIAVKSTKENKYWKSGIGFGFSGRKEWDIESFVAAEKEKESNICLILNDVYNYIKINKNNMNLIKILEQSALIPIIENYLIGSTILEISKHIKLYTVIINIINDLTSDEYIYLLDKLPNQNKSINEILQSMSSEAVVFLSTISKSMSEYNNDDKKEIELIQHILDIIDILDAKLTTKIDCDEKKVENNIDKSLEDKYKLELSKLQYDSMTINNTSNTFIKMKESSVKLSRKGIMRVGKELCIFQKSLPLSLSSSVFLRTDDSKSHIMQFIITGPEDTPYSNGCFLFDLVIPSNYPNEAPKCLLVTTGGGSVRFNPNLYNCGKVCLSLLGTWSGTAGEKWNKDTSTLLQLLVSIQSLILVPNPYFNEPGYESEMHSDYGKKQNKSYNENIRYQNMKWAILDQLKNPSKGFETVIKTHFSLKKDKILEECNKWLIECSDDNKEDYELTLNSIKEEFEKL